MKAPPSLEASIDTQKDSRYAVPAQTASSEYEFGVKGLKLSVTAETFEEFRAKDLVHEPLTYQV